ncbi:MAG: metallophosphoesterase family protein [Planctomycetota bacterium]|jgi:diadenosine tetraphosphatase ApaH/serine/threonine PP2A family protein phosphatase
MRYGIISDIHGNLHALQVVLSRLGELEVDEVICLGDVVGYGPYPGCCLDLVYKLCTVVVQGNHDEAVVDPHCARMFNGPAREAIYWTRDRLGPLHLDGLNRMKPRMCVGSHIMCVHASPVPGPDDYIHDKERAARAFGGVDRAICLVGHTHVPMIFEAANGAAEPAAEPADLVAYLPADGVAHQLHEGRRYICNPGSVGQPRDCDPRASFAVLDMSARTFTVHRQEYDIHAAQEATQRAGLPIVLAERLAIGA